MSDRSRTRSADDVALEALLDADARAALEARTVALTIRNAMLRAIEVQRERSGLSKKQLAKATSLDYAALRRLLTADDANPTLDTVARLLAATHIRMQLVTEDGEVVAIPDGSESDLVAT